MAYFENISLEKGMYSTPGKSFTQVLEELDSSENYRGTALDGLDAYQRQLKRFAIKVSGPESGTVEQFFQSSSSAALFPEYVARAVGQGMESGGKIEDLVAGVTRIEGLDYRSISMGAAAPAPDETAEAAQLPTTDIRTNAQLVKLRKRGQVLAASYEALRFQKLELLTVALRQIGAYIAAAQKKDAVDTLINGDGSQEGIAFVTGGAPGYADFIGLWGKLSPFTLNTVAAGTAMMQKLLQVPEFKDAQAGMNFQGTGKLCTPLGAKLLHVPDMPENKIVVLDKSCALEMVQSGGIVTDYDKPIDRQLERAAVSVTCGFARLFAGAAAGLDCTQG